MKQARVIGIAPQLIVPDVNRTVMYYHDILGFNIIALVQDPPVYGMVERDGFQIHFAKSDHATIHANHHLRSIAHDFILWVPEIDVFYTELTSRGVTILQTIVQRVYGSREFVFEDCDGHRILVGD